MIRKTIGLTTYKSIVRLLKQNKLWLGSFDLSSLYYDGVNTRDVSLGLINRAFPLSVLLKIGLFSSLDLK